jgi:murein tripeptide amidase MpaA
MVNITFDQYYRYDELTRILNEFAEEYPNLVTLESIGKTYEGRDIWLLTITNQETGAAADKPAVWVDANIHASEVSGSSAALHLIYTLTTKYGEDERVTYALDSRTFYVVPRITADGAEWALADKPKIRRSSIRPYPFDEEAIEGLEAEDIDGDGRILMMRIEDPNGNWKASEADSRLLVRREPDDFGGVYYRVIMEGLLENYDGIHIKAKVVKEGLDLNRNFPNNWRPEKEQAGAGPFPLSEPEIHAFAKAVSERKNICIATAFHTFSGVLLRPSANKPDTELPGEDVWIFQEQGQKGTDLTGYPNISIFHEFKYHPQQVISGGADWMYNELGIFYWAVEIWSPQRQAGIEEYKYIDWYRKHDIEDALKMLKWSDEVLEGKGYVDWYEYEHPQLGKVELGGWDIQYSWRNPPPQFLDKEIAPFSDWFIWQALTTPKLEIFDISLTNLADDTYHIRLAVQNTGWLPSYCSKIALQKGLVRGVIAEIELPEGARLKTGKKRMELNQLEGRSNTGSSISPWAMFRSAGTADRTFAEWVVQAPKGTEITVIARHDRAGTVRESIILE